MPGVDGKKGTKSRLLVSTGGFFVTLFRDLSVHLRGRDARKENEQLPILLLKTTKLREKLLLPI